tara:strand:+ start:18314 stop:19075 length:762 start_codon:yes stop_codon:yes gene_type:complete
VLDSFHILPQSHPTDLADDQRGQIILVAKSAPVALLSVCRQLHHEATPFLTPLLAILRAEPSRFIVDSSAFQNWYADADINTYITRTSIPDWFPSYSQYVRFRNREIRSTTQITAEIDVFVAKYMAWFAGGTARGAGIMRYRRTIFALRNVTADGDGSGFSAQDGVMLDCCRCVRGLFPRQNERRKFSMVFTPCADLAGDGEGAERLRRRHDALQWSAATLNGEESRTWHDNDVDMLDPTTWLRDWEEGERYA